MSDPKVEALLAKLGHVLEQEQDEEVHIFTGDEVVILLKVVGWVRFVRNLGSLAKAMLWTITALGGAWLMYENVIERIRGG